MALSIAFIAFLTYKDMLSYFFSNMDTTFMIFHWRIGSLHDIVRIFTEPWTATWYRPIFALTSGIDYAIWGINPFGWNLTSVILHVLVSVCLFFIMLLLTKGELFIAWLSAVIFTTHPILANDVLVVTYRQDVIAALLMLLTLLFFLKHASSVSKKRYYIFLSLLFFVITLGAKEVTIITPLIIFAYILIFSNGKSTKEKMHKAIRECMPFFLLALLYFAWRTYLLHGMGGYGKFLKVSTLTNTRNYFAYLLDPVGLLNLRLEYIFLLTVLALFFYRQEIKSSFKDSIYGRLVIFLLIWMMLPLVLFLFALGVIDSRQAYIPAIPFSGVVSVIFVKSLQSTISQIGQNRQSLIKSLIASLMTLCLIAYLSLYSPLIRNYREVENCGKICKTVLDKLIEIIPKLPANATIYINNLPLNVFPRGASPLPDGSCFEDGNYRKFLEYYYPGNSIKLVPQYTIWNIDTSYPLNVDSDMKIEIKEDKDKNAVELDIKILNEEITISD